MGFRSTITGELACTTSKTIEEAEIVYVPGEMVRNFVKSNGNFAMDLLQIACRELGEANDYITDIAQKTVRERLSEVIIQLKWTFDTDRENFLQISLTREELANIVGTATESVIRLLSEFKQDKLIEMHGRRIKILEEAKLIKTSAWGWTAAASAVVRYIGTKISSVPKKHLCSPLRVGLMMAATLGVSRRQA